MFSFDVVCISDVLLWFLIKISLNCLHIVDSCMFDSLFLFVVTLHYYVLYRALPLKNLLIIPAWQQSSLTHVCLRKNSLKKRISKAAKSWHKTLWILFFLDFFQILCTNPNGAHVNNIQNLCVLTLILWIVLWEGRLITAENTQLNNNKIAFHKHNAAMKYNNA